MEDLLRVGVITATHGIRGEVKVFPTTDDPQRFKKLKQCVIEGRRENKQRRMMEIMECERLANTNSWPHQRRARLHDAG